MIPESWVPTFTFVLMIRHKQIRSTWDAFINSNVLGPPIVSSEWSFVSHSLSHVVLKRTHLISSYFRSFFHAFGTPLFKLCNVFPFSKIAINWLRLLLAVFLEGFGNSQYSMSNGTIFKNFDGVNFIDPTLNFSNELWAFAKDDIYILFLRIFFNIFVCEFFNNLVSFFNFLF